MINRSITVGGLLLFTLTHHLACQTSAAADLVVFGRIWTFRETMQDYSRTFAGGRALD